METMETQTQQQLQNAILISSQFELLQQQDADDLLTSIIKAHIDNNKTLDEIFEIEECKNNYKLKKHIIDIYNNLVVEPFRNNKQEQYIGDVIENLNNNDVYNRVLIKAPTGFGKTVLLYKIINIIKSPIILWLTPRRNLNKQSNDSKYTKFLTDIKYTTYNYSPDNSNDNIFDSLDNLDNLNNLDSSNSRFLKLHNFIKKCTTPLIIFVCYQSCKSLIPQLYKHNIIINLLVCDEAHYIESWGDNINPKHIVENNMDFKNLLLNHSAKVNTHTTANKFIEKIIFATATPNDTLNCNIFGDIIDHVQLYDLIKKHILCDFEVIIKKLENITPKDTATAQAQATAQAPAPIQKKAQSPAKTYTITRKTNTNIPTNKIELHLCEFVVSTMNTYKKKKGIIYFNTQHRARDFYMQMKKTYSEYKTFIYISDIKSTASSATIKNSIVDCLNYAEDDTNLQKFEDCTDPCIIITCDKLSYGYDNVLIDMLCFGDMRNSDIDIRQIIGRGLRNNYAVYPDKLLHIVIPIYKYNLLKNETINNTDKEILDKLTTDSSTTNIKYSKKMLLQLEIDKENTYYENAFRNLREFLLFIIGECGKDIIDGVIQSHKPPPQQLLPPPPPPPPLLEPEKSESVIIPSAICRELSTTYYSKYTEFIKYLARNSVYNSETYNTFKIDKPHNEWMPILGEIRIRYKKFCFKDINARENNHYYNTIEECNEAYDKIKAITTYECGGSLIVKKMLKSTYNDLLYANILKHDNKIPLNKDKFYYVKQ